MVIVSIISVIAPAGRMQGIFKYFISLFFITSIIVPFTQVKNVELFDFEHTQFQKDTQNYTQSVNEQTIKLAEKILKEKIYQLLESIEITAQNIEFNIHTDKDNNIYISDLTLTLDNKFKAKQSEISHLLESEVNAKISFEYT